MSSPVPTVRLRTDRDFVAVVPYLIGYRPDDGSIAVLAFAEGRAVFAVRADLPDPDICGDVLPDLGSYLADVTRREHPNAEIVLVGYGPADHVDPALRTIGAAFTGSGLAVWRPLRVTDSRIFHLDCDDPGCPADGTPFDPTASPVAAEATFAGVVAFPDRAAKAALLAPSDATFAEAMRQADLRAMVRLRSLVHDDAAVDEAAATALADAVSRHATGTALSDDEVAWLVVLLTRPSVWSLAVEHTTGDDQHLAFWTEVTRRAPQTIVSEPATLLAVTAWRFGDGMIATLAAERALHADPSHTLAALILHAVHSGVSPAVVERALTGSDPQPGPLTDVAPRE
jgi:hypothetical protein